MFDVQYINIERCWLRIALPFETKKNGNGFNEFIQNENRFLVFSLRHLIRRIEKSNISSIY